MPVRSHVQHSGQSRQSHDRDYNNGDSSGSRPNSPTWRDDSGSEQRGRTSTDATPRPTPSHPRNLGSVVAHDTNSNILGSSSSAADFFSPSRRLALFGGGGDKGSSSHSHHQHNSSTSSLATARGHITAAHLLPPRSHSRAESALALNREASASPIPSISGTSMASSSTVTAAKAHTSPSKASTGRTYDSNLVKWEMHRLGNLAHLPSALAPTLSAAASATSLAIPSQGSSSSVSSAGGGTGDNPWASLHVHVLPLFVGEPLRIPIEDLNILVNHHIKTVLQSPSKALATLEHDISELIAAGMVTLNAKFIGVEDEKLVARVVELWGFFWDQVLPYVEGALLPLQTSPLLSALYRNPKTHRSSSPNRQNTKPSISSMHTLLSSAYNIDVRTVTLRSFRDLVILPLFSRLFARISMPNRQDSFTDSIGYQQPRLQQMLLVLASQSQQRPSTFSLTEPAPQPTSGEAAICDLLRMLRSPRPKGLASKVRKSKTSSVMTVQAPSFLSGGMPGDRRGRIAQKTLKTKGRAGGGHDHVDEDSDGVLGDGGETPRIGLGSAAFHTEREQGREFLEALRSPGRTSPGPRASVGGWGLGAGNEDSGRLTEEEDDDETLDWDEAQAVVERMVGMQPSEPPPEARRRLT